MKCKKCGRMTDQVKLKTQGHTSEGSLLQAVGNEIIIADGKEYGPIDDVRFTYDKNGSWFDLMCNGEATGLICKQENIIPCVSYELETKSGPLKSPNTIKGRKITYSSYEHCGWHEALEIPIDGAYVVITNYGDVFKMEFKGGKWERPHRFNKGEKVKSWIHIPK
jgi:hypothetical protein